MSGEVRWVTAFLDTAPERAEQAESFWPRVTGYHLSPRRGTPGEFASLLPADGDPHLKVQTVVQSSPGGLHVDLHTDDVRALAARAEGLGASARYLDAGYVVCGSPGGMTFCVVGHPASRAASPARWPGGRSMVDQVCLDIPPPRWEEECRFWADLTGWELVDQNPGDEFRRLRRPVGLTIQVLLQRLDDEQSVVLGHLDLGSDDYLAETDRHLALGATEVRRTPGLGDAARPKRSSLLPRPAPRRRAGGLNLPPTLRHAASTRLLSSWTTRLQLGTAEAARSSQAVGVPRCR